MMRIITGKARGVRLATLEGEATRPTSERTKEAVFSSLQFEIDGKNVLDLFAGSGQMGLEALSRGASHAVLIDRSKDAVEIVKRNTLKTRLAPDCEIYCTDWMEYLRTSRVRSGFDLVFLDPPYALGVIPDVLRALIRYRKLSPGAAVVCESASPEDVFGGDASLQTRFAVRKQTRYGIAWITVLDFDGSEAVG